jgi:hypothetical protein
MPQLSEGQSWPDMSSDEILVQMYERFTFAQQFMNALPKLSFSDKSVNEQRVHVPRQRHWQRRLSVDLPPLTGFAVTRPTFDYYVIDDPMPLIGDQTCDHNARSAYLRCAINPCGPCEGCSDYQPGVAGGGGAL